MTTEHTLWQVVDTTKVCGCDNSFFSLLYLGLRLYTNSCKVMYRCVCAGNIIVHLILDTGNSVVSSPVNGIREIFGVV